MVRSRALVIPLLAFVILLLVPGMSPAFAEDDDDAGTGGDAVPGEAAETAVLRTGIKVTQTCPATAAIGDTVDFVVTVINTGEEPLKGIKVAGPLLGDVGWAFADNLDVGGEESHSFSHVVTATDPDPLESVVTAKTEGAVTDESENDTVACATEVVPAQAAPPTVEPTQQPRQVVLPTQFLPRTGLSLPGLATAGFGFLMLGTAMVTRSYRGPQLALIGGMGRRLSGRSRWSWGPPPSWRLIAILQQDRGGFVTRSHVVRRSGFRKTFRRTEASGE